MIEIGKLTNVDVFSVCNNDLLNTTISNECRINEKSIEVLEQEDYNLLQERYFIKNSTGVFHLWDYSKKEVEEHHIEHSNVYFILDESNFIINVGRYRDLNKHLYDYPFSYQ